MKRFIGLVSLGAIVISLTGCSSGVFKSHDQDYVKQAGSVYPVVPPAGVKLRQAQNFYPIPGTPDTKVAPPSDVPPGSDFGRFAKAKKPAATPKITQAKWSETPTGEPTLLLAQNIDTAWKSVNGALVSARLKILDKDTMMHSFYVLSKGDKVTTSTPIYRIALDKKGHDTQIEVLDSQNKLVDKTSAKQLLTVVQQHLA